MFNWEINAVRTATASPADVYNIWKDVPNWPTWDTSLEWTKLNGEFAEGTTGVLKPKGWFSSQFTITRIVPNSIHSDTTYMPLTTLVFNHQVKKINDTQVEIAHNMKVSGLLAPLLYLTMRFQLKNAIPVALENLIKKLKRKNINVID